MTRPNGAFRALFLSSTASNLGDGVMVAAFPLLAAAITRDPVAVAAMTAAATAPWLLFGLPAGVVVDRVDRLRLMRLVDGARVGIVAALAAAVSAGIDRMPALYVTVFALGCAETLYDSAAMSLVPAMVPDERLERANGRLFAGQLAANQFVGPPLGALLFSISVAAPLWLDAATFAVSAVLLLGIPKQHAHTEDSEPTKPAHVSLVADIVEGIRWIWRQHDIRLLAIGAGVINFAETAGLSVAVLYATGALGMTDRQFGWVFTAAAAGALVGTLVADRAVRRLGRRRAIVSSVWIFAAALLLVGAVALVAGLAVGLAATSFAAQIWNVVAVTYRQRATPPRLLGRVMSGYRFIAYGSFPVGALAGGAFAALTSPRWTFLAAGGVVTLLAIAISVRLGTLTERHHAGETPATT